MAINLTKTQLNKLPKLAEGGEAIIYAYDKNTVLKIFKNPAVLPIKQQKVESMLGKTARGGTAVLPIDVVLINGKFAGYQMIVIQDADPLHNFTKARFVRDHGLNNLDALQIVTQLSHAKDDVHSAGFVIGDVSDNNFMASVSPGHRTYMIDTDSWGGNGFPPDAYTETFTPPEAYSSRGMKLTKETDNFGFRVLAFNVLTRIHPFGGSYKKNPNMNTVERIKNRLSLLGQHDIVYNDTLFNWSWMSPKLIETMKEGFEGDRRDSITAELDEQLAHSKLCKIHGLYYFDRYTDCPLCSGVAKLKPVIQVITTVPTAAGPKVVVVFADPNVRLMLDQNTYFDNSGNIVYLPTKKSFPRLPNARMHFTSGGRYLVSMLPAKMQVKDGDGKDIANIERMMNSSYAVEGANVLYVDTGDVLHKMLLSSIGLQDQALFQASNPLLSLNELGEYFVVNRYHDRIMVSYKNHDVEITVKPKFKEYVIKYDAVTKTWLFIYEEASGAFRTMIFGENGKEYDDNVVRYSATPLSNIAYRNGTVYDPGIKSFTGTNLKKGTSKIFQCDAVDETCMLKLEGNSFIIVGDTSVSRFG